MEPNNSPLATASPSIFHSLSLSRTRFSSFCLVFSLSFCASEKDYSANNSPNTLLAAWFVLFFHAILYYMSWRDVITATKEGFVKDFFWKRKVKSNDEQAGRYFKIIHLWYFKVMTSKKLCTNMSRCLALLLFAQCSNLSSGSFEGNSTILRSIEERSRVVCQRRPLVTCNSENVNWSIFIFHLSARVWWFSLSFLHPIHQTQSKNRK